MFCDGGAAGLSKARTAGGPDFQFEERVGRQPSSQRGWDGDGDCKLADGAELGGELEMRLKMAYPKLPAFSPFQTELVAQPSHLVRDGISSLPGSRG
jgi:hypothetical protein